MIWGPCFRKPSYMPVQNPVYGTFLSSIQHCKYQLKRVPHISEFPQILSGNSTHTSPSKSFLSSVSHRREQENTWTGFPNVSKLQSDLQSETVYIYIYAFIYIYIYIYIHISIMGYRYLYTRVSCYTLYNSNIERFEPSYCFFCSCSHCLR